MDKTDSTSSEQKRSGKDQGPIGEARPALGRCGRDARGISRERSHSEGCTAPSYTKRLQRMPSTWQENAGGEKSQSRDEIFSFRGPHADGRPGAGRSAWFTRQGWDRSIR